MEPESIKNLPALLEERTVVKHTVGSREFLLAHRTMVDVTTRPNKRGGKFLSLDGLIGYAKTNGKQNESIVFFNEKEVKLFLDEEWRENIGAFVVEKSKALKRWIFDEKAKTGVYDQQGLIEHLECWSDEVEAILPPEGQSAITMPTVLLAIMNLSLKAKISYDRKYQDRNNQTLKFQISEEDGTGAEQVLVPKNWVIKIPVLEGGEPESLQVRLVWHVPRNQNEEPYFYFECPKLDMHMEQAVEKIGEKLRVKLADWQVYKGTATQST